MDIKRCDRCGKAYNIRGNYGVRFGRWLSSGLDDIGDPKSTFSSYDLCENCAYAFMKWFNKTAYRKDVCVTKGNHGFFILNQNARRKQHESSTADI